MSTIWTTTLSRKYQVAIDQLERALLVCPKELWEESLWEVKREHRSVWPVRRVDDKRYGNEATQQGLLPVHSAFWNVAYHALFHLDFYLSCGDLPFDPPPPFREDEHRAHVLPNRPYTPAELLRYVVHIRAKARETLSSLSDEDAERMLRRRRQPFAELLVGNMIHAYEHAAQLNLFLSQRGVEPEGGAIAEHERQYLRENVRDRSDNEIDAFARSLGGYERLLPPVFAGICSGIHPVDTCTVLFDLGEPYVVRVLPGSATFDQDGLGQLDATVHVSRQDFLRWMTGCLDIESATSDGRVTIDGDSTALWRQMAKLRGTN